MLIIREEQIQALMAGDDSQMRALVTNAVRAANPSRVEDYDDDVLGSMVEIAIGRAKSHDLSKVEDIAAFAAVMFEIAPNFDEQRDIKIVLNEPHFSPADRFYQLFERIEKDAWAEAEKRYDELVWFPSRPRT